MTPLEMQNEFLRIQNEHSEDLQRLKLIEGLIYIDDYQNRAENSRRDEIYILRQRLSLNSRRLQEHPGRPD